MDRNKSLHFSGVSSFRRIDPRNLLLLLSKLLHGRLEALCQLNQHISFRIAFRRDPFQIRDSPGKFCRSGNWSKNGDAVEDRDR